jgi:predicted nucleotidyltransferase
MDIPKAAERLRRKYEAEEKSLELRRKEAFKKAEEIASVLGNSDAELEQVYGFGSVFEQWRRFRKDSDIDLAITGGNWSKLMRAIPESDFSVDLIELELQNRDFIEYVKDKGVLLYDKKC